MICLYHELFLCRGSYCPTCVCFPHRTNEFSHAVSMLQITLCRDRAGPLYWKLLLYVNYKNGSFSCNFVSISVLWICICRCFFSFPVLLVSLHTLFSLYVQVHSSFHYLFLMSMWFTLLFPTLSWRALFLPLSFHALRILVYQHFDL